MKAYSDLVKHVLANGTRKENRTGVDTISTFNYNYELGFGKENLYQDPGPNYYHLGNGFPMDTTKKISWKNIAVEMLWFLSGDISAEILRRHKCRFWEPWVNDNGEVPAAYGAGWRNFPIHLSQYDPGYFDQIEWLLDTLKTNPMSRRLITLAWMPYEANFANLPPCHFAFAFNVQFDQDGEQRLCLHLTQRSCDIALGIPYNIASYALLLMLFSHMTGIKPGIFAHTLLDAHIYTSKPDGSMAEYDHIPGLQEQILREPKDLPRLIIDPSIKELSDIEALMAPEVSTQDILEKLKLEGYDPHPTIKFKVAV